LYVYDAEALAARVAELQNVLPVNRMLYSFKANPLPSVASELRRNGCQADLTSPGEITAAREEGFDLSLALSGSGL
jgi:diaminopimelate decarboxylase